MSIKVVVYKKKLHIEPETHQSKMLVLVEFKTFRVNKIIRGEFVVCLRQGKRSHEKHIV